MAPTVSYTDPPVKAVVTSEIPELEAQVRLRNKIVTAYRSAEGKTVTNHKPSWQYLKSKGWKFLWNAPGECYVYICFCFEVC